MKQDDTVGAEQIWAAIDAEARLAINSDVDIWPRIAAKTARRDGRGKMVQRARAPRPIMVVGSCLALLLGGLGFAAAASPAVRHLLPGVVLPPPGHFGTASDRTGRPLGIFPIPAFRVFFPDPMPRRLPVHTIVRVPGMGSTMSFECPKRGGRSNCDRLSRQVRPRSGISPLLRPFVTGSTDAILFGFYDFRPGGRSVEIVEWRAADRTAGPGISNRPTVVVAGRLTTVTEIRQGTAIQVQTNLGRSVALHIVGSLRTIDVSGKG